MSELKQNIHFVPVQGIDMLKEGIKGSEIQLYERMPKFPEAVGLFIGSISTTQIGDEKALAYSKLFAAAPDMLADLIHIQNIMEDSGRAACTYGDTEYDSLSVVYGYNLALQHVKSHITSIDKATK